jgi:hypothetical protein
MSHLGQAPKPKAPRTNIAWILTPSPEDQLILLFLIPNRKAIKPVVTVVTLEKWKNRE